MFELLNIKIFNVAQHLGYGTYAILMFFIFVVAFLISLLIHRIIKKRNKKAQEEYEKIQFERTQSSKNIKD